MAVYGEHCDADCADAERLARIVPLTHLPIDGIRNFFEALFGSESEPGCEEAELGVIRRRSDAGECC